MAVYSWGANSHGQLALGYANELCVTPREVSKISFAPGAVRCIRGGGGHVLVLDTSGQVHSCGWNNRGQLGVDCTADKHEFICIPREYFKNAPVEHIACGWDTSGAITADKELFLWGSNGFHQLGFCKRHFTSVTKPLNLALPLKETPVQISFGLHHCCILTEENKVYVLGKLKIKEVDADLTISPVQFSNMQALKIQTDLKIDAVVCGQNHFLLVTCNYRRIIGVGDNKYGQANLYCFDDKIKYAECGWTHNGVLTKTNEVYLWGRNSYGQIGEPQRESIQIPTKLCLEDGDTPTQMHLGSEHGIAMSKGKKVYTWGWNEHGNCGNGRTENVYFPSIVDLPAPCRIVGTGAGFCYAICEDSPKTHQEQDEQ